MKFKALGLAGLLFLSNCETLNQKASPNSKIPFEEEYGTRLMIAGEPNSNLIFFGYDRDNDENIDFGLAYEVIHIDQSGTTYLELKAVVDDKNRNGNPDEGEIRRINGEYNLKAPKNLAGK